MPGKLTLFPSEGPSRSIVLREGEARSLGRDPASGIALDDPRVSALHAEIRFAEGEWRLRDEKSKNGTFVNAIRVTEASLQAGDWISLGGLLTRFEVITEADVERLRAERERRLQTFTEARRILDSKVEPRDLLARLLASVVELTGAERGLLVLFSPDGRLSAEVVSGFSAGTSAERFPGSFGAIERSLATGRSVVTSSAKTDAYLGTRPSVIEMGIETLACVPLRGTDRPAGLLYVDGRKSGGAFTDLDLEILEALSDHASVAVATLELDRQIREIVGAPEPDAAAGEHSFLAELERRVGTIAPLAAARPAAP
ncbi:MAG TPA: FHA domain-containing protein [Thermoanaerobaculia bacterium]|jgi:adenylate cyclase|nr:FHA domain-containing protein [Thermoanaerobaculia bacterium]